MIDIEILRKNPNSIKESLKKRGIKNIDIENIAVLDQERRKAIVSVETLKAERNVLTEEIAKTHDKEKIEKAKGIKAQIDELQIQADQLEAQFKEEFSKIPNMVHPGVPVGGENDFKVIYTNKKPEKFSFEPKDHEELMIALDVVDFERGAKVSASKFYFAKNELVRLNQALINFGIDTVTKHGYELVETPDIAKNEILSGIGFTPRGPETQVYSLEGTDLSLIGTAEITMGGYHANEILDLSKGPKKYVALSHCFRTEAGSYGRESKGLYRVHQFTKLEMFVYCKPEESEKMHQEILDIEKEICDNLGLAYRVIDIASGDLGAPAYRKFDIEAHMTMKGEEKYGEITSTSNCTDYQARRLNIKYRKENGETEFAHTLNGTAVVLSRFPIAIFEQFQQEDGSISIPEVLRKYTGFDLIKK